VPESLARGRVVVGGEALVDLVPTPGAEDGTDDPALRTLVPRRGGGPFNTAVGLGRLGVPTSMLTRLSTDPFGASLAARLADNDVDDALVQRGDEPTTLAVVTLDAEGRARYSFHVEGTADRLVADPGPLPDDTVALALGTLSLVLEPGASVYAELLVREAARGVFVSLDPNVRPALVADPDGQRARLDGLLPHVGLVKLSDEDAAWWGREPEELLEAGAGAVVLTRGPDGLAVVAPGVRAEVPAAGPGDARGIGPVVDTIGAGDSVHAALLAWLHARGALGRDAPALDAAAWTAALGFAAEVAARTCARAGAEPPRRHELSARPGGDDAPPL
jgi:fructokinase